MNVSNSRQPDPGDGESIDRWADRFQLLSDRNRLRLLAYLNRAPDISVNDLAAALDMSPTAVSHSLRLLRHHRWVAATREGRLIRYRIADEIVHDILRLIGT